MDDCAMSDMCMSEDVSQTDVVKQSCIIKISSEAAAVSTLTQRGKGNRARQELNWQTAHGKRHQGKGRHTRPWQRAMRKGQSFLCCSLHGAIRVSEGTDEGN